MFGKTYPNCVKNTKEDIDEAGRVARKPGQPANSKKHSDLYTDENPRGTITGLKFATVEDARTSVSKIRASGRSHAHKIQAAVAMEQRARAAGKTSAAAVYRAYINANKKTNEQQLDEKCWDGYTQQGMKNKSGCRVPNCVPVSEQDLEEDLRKWFKEKWVRFGPDGKIRGDCARGSSKEGKPKCLPQSKAQALGKKGRASSAAKKRRQDPNANRRGAAKNVATKVREQSVVEYTGKKSADEIRRIQQMLNTKFDANLDIDGVMGPLTVKTIKKFLPATPVKSAPNPERTTSVQGKELKSEQQLDELQFLGSECTKDCSGHRAGYNWSRAQGGVDGMSPWSPSFNKGAALAKAGK